MTKAVYQRIAAVIAENRALAIAALIELAKDPITESEYDQGWLGACEQIAAHLTVALRGTNPNYDEERFLKACGVGE